MTAGQARLVQDSGQQSVALRGEERLRMELQSLLSRFPVADRHRHSVDRMHGEALRHVARAQRVVVADPNRVERLLSASFGSADYRKGRSEEHPSDLQSLMRISYADFCL